MNGQEEKNCVVKGILTDIHFWIPVIVLAIGVLILIYVSKGG